MIFPKQTAALLGHLIEARLGILQVGSIEAFREPAVYRREHRTRFIAPRNRNAQVYWPSLEPRLAQVPTKTISIEKLTLQTSGRKHAFHSELRVAPRNSCDFRACSIVLPELHIVDS